MRVLVTGLGGKFDGPMPPIARRGAAQVDAGVENAAGQHADQLGLGKRRNLEVHPAHRTGCMRKRLVPLHEFIRDPGSSEIAPHVGLGEIAALIAEARRADEFDFGNREWANAQLHCGGP